MTNIVRNTLRVLRGVFVLRAFLAVFGMLVFAVRWSILSPPESFPSMPPRVVPLLLVSVFAAIFSFVPAFEKYLKTAYLPAALILTTVAFSLEYGLSYLNPESTFHIILPGGQALRVFWASTEMLLLVLIPCLLAGMAYGVKGALLAATLATVMHLILGIIVRIEGLSVGSYLLLLPLRLGVLYGFPIMTGILADTWRREHAALLRANDQVRGYAATIENLATSRERVRLARAMHDTLAHSLAALVIQLEAVSALQESDPGAVKEQLVKVQQQARVGLDETRRAILDLRSAPVEEMGLAGALASLVEQFGRKTGLRVRWESRGDPIPLLPVQANALYRIAEEALDNIARHSGAGELCVCLDYTNGVALIVRDDGRGFDPDDVRAGSYGLVGIRERATLIGGVVHVQSAPGAGTTITVRIADAWDRNA